MRRRRHAPGKAGESGWMVTFADLTTLLLTFFVLLVSMSSMDSAILTQINLYTRTVGFLGDRGAGKIPQRIQLIAELLREPWTTMEKPNRIKDLLFPEDVLPPEIDRSTLLENIAVLEHPEGVALVLSEQLLFEPGQAALTQAARVALEQVGLMLRAVDSDAKVAGHAGPRDKAPNQADARPPVDGASPDLYALTSERALAVLGFLVDQKLPEHRFSLASHGPDLPPEPRPGRADPLERAGRVEILLRTTPHFRGY